MQSLKFINKVLILSAFILMSAHMSGFAANCNDVNISVDNETGGTVFLTYALGRNNPKVTFNFPDGAAIHEGKHLLGRLVNDGNYSVSSDPYARIDMAFKTGNPIPYANEPPAYISVIKEYSNTPDIGKTLFDGKKDGREIRFDPAPTAGQDGFACQPYKIDKDIPAHATIFLK